MNKKQKSVIVSHNPSGSLTFKKACRVSAMHGEINCRLRNIKLHWEV